MRKVLCLISLVAGLVSTIATWGLILAVIAFSLVTIFKRVKKSPN